MPRLGAVCAGQRCLDVVEVTSGLACLGTLARVRHVWPDTAGASTVVLERVDDAARADKSTSHACICFLGWPSFRGRRRV